MGLQMVSFFDFADGALDIRRIGWIGGKFKGDGGPGGT